MVVILNVNFISNEVRISNYVAPAITFFFFFFNFTIHGRQLRVTHTASIRIYKNIYQQKVFYLFETLK